MRSRRLPGQRPGNDPGSGIRRPPPPPEPAPLPAEVYFDAQSRRRAEPASNEEVEASPGPQAAASPGVTLEGISKVYGARTIAAAGIFIQVSVGLLLLPRIVNAAETLLVNPKQLIVLAAVGIVEVTMAGWGFWTRSWFGAVSSVLLGIAWWIYLLVQVFA